MRIGLARRGYSSTGGAEAYLRRLAAGLELTGHECVLFAGPEWPREQWSGAGFHPLAGAKSPRAFADRLEKERQTHACDLLFSLERVWRCDCYRAGDGVHRAWLQRRARVEPAWKTRLRRWNPKHRQILALEAALFSGGGAKCVIANSRMVRDEIAEHYHYPPERIAVVPNGLPSGYLEDIVRHSAGNRAATRAALGLREDDCALLFAGSGWERKSLRHAVAALALLLEDGPTRQRPVLLVAGRGNPRPYRAGLPSRVADRVRFLGPVADMLPLYAAADVFVLPTLYDPFSNACLEALAAGLPVITTRANGFSEILIPGVHGDVADEQAPGFESALAAILTHWLDPARREHNRRLCRELGSQYTIAENVRQTLDFLRRRGLLGQD